MGSLLHNSTLPLARCFPVASSTASTVGVWHTPVSRIRSETLYADRLLPPRRPLSLPAVLLPFPYNLLMVLCIETTSAPGRQGTSRNSLFSLRLTIWVSLPLSRNVPSNPPRHDQPLKTFRNHIASHKEGEKKLNSNEPARVSLCRKKFHGRPSIRTGSLS
jgi:hypothetical protein